MATGRRGFTLIELLIVVVIIGILASIAIPKFRNSKEQAYISAMREDVHNLAVAQEAYVSDNAGNYATSIAALGTNYKPSVGVTITLTASQSSWEATASSTLTATTCQLAAGTTKTYDGAITCK